MARFRRALPFKTCLLLAALLTGAPASFVSNAFFAAQEKVLPVGEARRLSRGEVVTIEGTVTVPAGTFKSSLSDEGFALEDQSGGIYVSMSVNLRLRVAERVRVTGRLAQSNNMLVLVPANAQAVVVRGRAAQVKLLKVSTGEVGEQTAGRLLKVTGIITRPVVNDAPYGFRLFINDRTGEIQVYISASTGIVTSGLRPGRRISVTGFGGQYKDHYEIDPRFPADIRGRRRPAPRPAP